MNCTVVEKSVYLQRKVLLTHTITVLGQGLHMIGAAYVQEEQCIFLSRLFEGVYWF